MEDCSVNSNGYAYIMVRYEVPYSALSVIANNLTYEVQVVLELAPPHLNWLCYELEDDLLKV